MSLCGSGRVERDGCTLPGKAARRFGRSERTREPGGTDLEAGGARNRLVHFQTVRQAPAENGAVPDRDPPRFVEQNPQDPFPTLRSKLNIDQLIARFVRGGPSELSDFFSQFQRALLQRQKTEWSQLPHS